LQTASPDFDSKELDWFSRTGYNLGLRGVVEWSPATALKIFETTMGFTELYQNTLEAVEPEEVTQRQLFLYYLCACLCINIARLDGTVEGQLQHYLYTRSHADGFRKLHATWVGRSEHEILDMRQKFATLLHFDFEAATRLKNWEILANLVDEAISLDAPESNVLEYIADLVIHAAAPQTTALIVLQKIVDHKIAVQYNRMTKLAAWIRWLVQFAMMRDHRLVEALLTQAIGLAKQAEADNQYPDEELQWLTGTEFHRRRLD
jgi:hypothetical protein